MTNDQPVGRGSRFRACAPSPCPACHACFDAPGTSPFGPSCPDCGYLQMRDAEGNYGAPECPNCRGWLYDATTLERATRIVRCAFCAHILSRGE